jgi:threonine synthase
MMVNDISLKAFSLLTDLRCPECGTIHNPAVINTVCINPDCRSTLFAQYNLSPDIDRSILTGRPATMWRYREFLPVSDPKYIVSLNEGFTSCSMLSLPFSNNFLAAQPHLKNDVLVKTEM